MPRHRVLLAVERSYFRAGGRIVVVADQLKVDVNEFYGVDPSDAITIHNGYSAAQCSPERRAANRDVMRREWGIGPGAVALLMVANELHRKGFATLVEAVALVGDPRLQVHLVGKASPDGFTRRIAELGLEGRVHYHGSVDTGLAHAAADALVLPTQYEAFALTIVEGLASGLPVVTTTVPGAGDRIEHGVSGLLCRNPTDATELACCLRQLLDPAVRDRLGAAAPAAVADLEWNEVMGQLYDLCQQTARGGPPNSLSDEKQLEILRGQL